jgi:putative pyruvate formate lyase activating enzyme
MSLEHYLAVRRGERPPRHVLARRLRLDPRPDLRLAQARGVEQLRRTERAPASSAFPDAPAAWCSLLEIKVELAERALDACDLCPHHCRVDRNAGQRGFCGVAAETAVHWEGILHGEELPLVPSHEVFLSGCTMRCAFCYSHEHILKPMSGRRTTPEELAGCIAARREQGAVNVNLVGGEPTVHLPNLLRTLLRLETPQPVVWNSNMYATPEAMALLDGVVDLFLGDIHFGSEVCARRLGGIPDYLPSVTTAFETAAASGASVISRHLVMPGHLECCARPAMEWAARVLPEVPFHLMFQYVPDFRAEGDPVLGRTLTREEIARCGQIAREVGVRLYEDGSVGSVRSERSGGREEPEVDILIHSDGRVSFTRLVEGLIPVAGALAQVDERVAARTGMPAGV